MADAVRELVIKVTVDADTKDLDKVEESQEKAKIGSVALGSALGGLALKLGEVAVAAVKAGAAMLTDLVFGTAEAADEIAKTSAQLDISAEGLQRLRGAATLTGGDAATLDKAMRTLQKGLADAAQKGTGPAAEALATLGLEVADVDSLLTEGDIEGAVGVIGDAFNATGDSAQKSAALMKLFGGAGTKLRPLVEEGTEGVRGLGDQIAATGSIIDDQALGQFEAMQDASFLLDKQFEGVTNTIAGAVAPAFTQGAASVQTWVAENDQMISQDLPAALTEIATVLIDVVTAGLEWASAARELARDTADFTEIAFEFASELRDDAQPAIDGVTEALEILHTPLALVGSAAEFVGDAIGDMVLQFADAIGVADELNAALKTLRETFGEDDEITSVRGGAQFAGGGAALVNPADAKQAKSTGDTSKLKKIAADPQFSQADRAKAGAQAAAIDEREATKAAKAADARRAERRSAVDASRSRARAAREAQRAALKKSAPRRGGGGGGPAQPSVEDLVGAAQAPGGASAAALRSASSALSGTLVINNITNNNFASTVDVGGVTVSAALPVEIGPAAAAAIDNASRNSLAEQNRELFELFSARANVGP